MEKYENKIPQPEESGSSGDQGDAAPDSEFVPARTQVGQPPVMDALEGLMASRSKSLGEFGSAMLVATTRQLTNDNFNLTQQNKQLTENLATQRDALETERVQNAVLSERISSQRRNRHVRNLAITVGTGLISTGIMLSRANNEPYSWGVIVVGALLLLASWFAPEKGAGK